MDYTFLLGALENIIGKGDKKSRDNYAFHCPFCSHHKKKLEIDLHTNENGENHFACWTCGAKGKTIRGLVRQMKLPTEQASSILKYLPKGTYVEYKGFETLELPAEFKPLYNASLESRIVQKIKVYLSARGVTETDIIRYNMGYCTSGKYSGRIIIPSYDGDNKLNFFVGRTYEDSHLRYLLPETSRDIIAFENLINWKQPIILCEGVFDVIGGARRNAIPLLGKNISNQLLKKILESDVEEIYIALDQDAIKQALKHCELFMNMGKKVYLVPMSGKDPNEMGFLAFTEHIQTIQELDFSKLLEYKLDL